MSSVLTIAACGIGGGIAGPIIFNSIGRISGHRQAGQDDHRGADPEDAPLPCPGGMSAIAAAGEDPGEDVTPDIAEPIIGLRAWTLRGGFLGSSYPGRYRLGVHWPAREKFTANCEQDVRFSLYEKSHAAPAEKCSCGIYACQRELEIQYSADSGPFVWGRVALWGRVVEHGRGWRAQYAYPVSLVLVNAPHNGHYPGMTAQAEPQSMWNPEVLEEARGMLAMRYGIPVRIGTLEELQDLHRENYEAMGLPAEVRELVG